MKKILAVFDGVHYSNHTASFGIDLARQTNSLLVGVFLHDLTYSRFVYTYAWDVPTQYYYGFQEIEEEENLKIKSNSEVFRKQCEKAGIKHKLHLDNGVPIQELLKECAFADLLLIDTTTSFLKIGDNMPSIFLKDLLSEAKIPVMILPDMEQPVNRAIIAYDGSDSSVYALKMYSYLFPEWENLPTNIVTVNHSTSNHIPKNRDLKDLADLHFRNITYSVFNGEPETELTKFVKKHPDSIVVMGAYARSTWSRMFHASVSNKILKEVKSTLFIAHQ